MGRGYRRKCDGHVVSNHIRITGNSSRKPTIIRVTPIEEISSDEVTDPLEKIVSNASYSTETLAGVFDSPQQTIVSQQIKELGTKFDDIYQMTGGQEFKAIADAYNRGDVLSGDISLLQTISEYDGSFVEEIAAVHAPVLANGLKEIFEPDKAQRWAKQLPAIYAQASKTEGERPKEAQGIITALSAQISLKQAQNKINQLPIDKYDNSIKEGIKSIEEIITLNEKDFGKQLDKTLERGEQKGVWRFSKNQNVWALYSIPMVASNSLVNEESLKRNIEWFGKHGQNHRDLYGSKLKRSAGLIVSSQKDMNILSGERFGNGTTSGLHYNGLGLSLFEPEEIKRSTIDGYSALVAHEMGHGCQAKSTLMQDGVGSEGALRRALIEGTNEAQARISLLQKGAESSVRSRNTYNEWTKLAVGLSNGENKSKNLDEFWRSGDQIEWVRKKWSPNLSKTKTVGWLTELTTEVEKAGYNNQKINVPGLAKSLIEKYSR